MGYETKVVLKGIYNFLNKCETIEEAKEYVKDIANAEGVVVGREEKKPGKKKEGKA